MCWHDRVDGFVQTQAEGEDGRHAGLRGRFESGTLGSALYLAASLFNHSCMPNVSVNHNTNDGRPPMPINPYNDSRVAVDIELQAIA